VRGRGPYVRVRRPFCMGEEALTIMQMRRPLLLISAMCASRSI